MIKRIYITLDELEKIRYTTKIGTATDVHLALPLAKLKTVFSLSFQTF